MEKKAEKKEYEAPVVTKVEIDFSDRIIAAGCGMMVKGPCSGSHLANS